MSVTLRPATAPPRPLAVKARAAAPAPVAVTSGARKLSDQVTSAGMATQTVAKLALVVGGGLMLFAPAGARALQIASYALLGLAGGGFLATFGLDRWVAKLDQDGR